MHKYKIILDTATDVAKFVTLVSAIDGKITVTDNNGLRINAKSLMGVLYALEFDELWCEAFTDIYEKIKEFVD